MGDNVPVRCPVCRRAHAYTPPAYPCACGAPVVPPLAAGAPAEPVTHRTWTDEWVTVRCTACGLTGQWPQPELGCPCGALLRLPVRPVTVAPHPPAGTPDAPGAPAGPAAGATVAGTGRSAVRVPAPHPSAPQRPDFRPVTIRTARDAVTAAARYLRWLGFRELDRPEERTAAGIDLRGPGVIAQVDPTTRPVSLRAVECLWLTGLAAPALSVFFSLAGYEEKARARAEQVGLPLFAMDLTGAPQPVGSPAEELVARGA
ncbi:hypothetical protein NX801_06885 [Streptomyces sp. LP05-1]|uniref:Restriction endonuclease n=1 Tax=Streptomyces pyxinae TaxID=2970734 RepID=A0ABT2CF75_9ACTN|nr:hypothetical protein [Streptomyces sp. LP05-1]MCS0635386.1 hypothetical protein [Streptomyces sp. LP05-1]